MNEVPPDIDAINRLMNEHEQLSAEISSPRFEKLKRLWTGRSVVGWSRRVRDAARISLRTLPPVSEIDERFLNELREDLTFQLVTYTSSVTAIRDYLFSWARDDSKLAVIDDIGRTLKYRPVIKCLTALRNRLNHGAMAVEGVKVKARTSLDPEGAGFAILPMLTEATLEDLNKADKHVGESIASDIVGGRDWMSSLISAAQEHAEEAWAQAEAEFNSVYGQDLARHAFCKSRVLEINAEIGTLLTAN